MVSGRATPHRARQILPLHYRFGGRVFGPKSLTLNVGFVTKGELIQLATDLTEQFHVESVLVKHNGSGLVYLVNGN